MKTFTGYKVKTFKPLAVRLQPSLRWIKMEKTTTTNIYIYIYIYINK